MLPSELMVKRTTTVPARAAPGLAGINFIPFQQAPHLGQDPARRSRSRSRPVPEPLPEPSRPEPDSASGAGTSPDPEPLPGPPLRRNGTRTAAGHRAGRGERDGAYLGPVGAWPESVVWARFRPQQGPGVLPRVWALAPPAVWAAVAVGNGLEAPGRGSGRGTRGLPDRLPVSGSSRQGNGLHLHHSFPRRLQGRQH